MQHIHRKHSLYSGQIDHPYTWSKGSFTKPDLNRQYVKVIQYVYDHPSCRRTDILRDIFGKNVNRKDKRYNANGNQSSLFANLLYSDLIDYDNHCNYYVTENGMKMLIDCYQKKMAELCMPKQMEFKFT